MQGHAARGGKNAGGRPIRRLYLHTSDSRFGDVGTIRTWHTEKPPRGNGWDDIGYHFVVLNGRREPERYVAADDGLVETGRALDLPGAHVAKENSDSIGICLVGKHGLYTVSQLVAATGLVAELLEQFDLEWSDVRGHYQAESARGKTCPDFLIEHFRALACGARHAIPLGGSHS